MSKEIYGSKATITFTTQQALDFITEKLQDDFSSNFKFSVEISDNSCIISTESQKSSSNPEAISDNPWLIPDKDGWFTHDPEYKSIVCPEYIDSNKAVQIMFRDTEIQKRNAYARDWSVNNKTYDIVKWKYA